MTVSSFNTFGFFHLHNPQPLFNTSKVYSPFSHSNLFQCIHLFQVHSDAVHCGTTWYPVNIRDKCFAPAWILISNTGDPPQGDECRRFYEREKHNFKAQLLFFPTHSAKPYLALIWDIYRCNIFPFDIWADLNKLEDILFHNFSMELNCIVHQIRTMSI